jgi:hypothetical protein
MARQAQKQEKPALQIILPYCSLTLVTKINNFVLALYQKRKYSYMAHSVAIFTPHQKQKEFHMARSDSISKTGAHFS